MEKYAPNKMELASRDVVSRSEQTEINEGRGFPDGTVALDITKVPRKRTLEALREIVNIGRDFAGVDITREPIHIRPGCHYIMGGVKTDVWGATSIPGLYAAGEVACVSVHGGNRLGANSLLDTLIFGRRSGEHAARRALGMAMPTVSNGALARDQKQIDEILGRAHSGGRRISEIKDELGTVMNEKCAVFRDEAGLDEALEVVRRLKEEANGRLHRRPRHRLQPGRSRGHRARVHARLCGMHRRRGARAQGVPRRAVPARLPQAQRRRVAQAHRSVARRRRGAQGVLLTGHPDQVGAPGADVLTWPNTR